MASALTVVKYKMVGIIQYIPTQIALGPAMQPCPTSSGTANQKSLVRGHVGLHDDGTLTAEEARGNASEKNLGSVERTQQCHNFSRLFVNGANTDDMDRYRNGEIKRV